MRHAQHLPHLQETCIRDYIPPAFVSLVRSAGWARLQSGAKRQNELPRHDLLKEPGAGSCLHFIYMMNTERTQRTAHQKSQNCATVSELDSAFVSAPHAGSVGVGSTHRVSQGL